MNELIDSVEDVKDKVITIALARADGNRAKAAKMLNMDVRTLQRKIAERIARDGNS